MPRPCRVMKLAKSSSCLVSRTPPPGAQGTMSVTGRAGQSAARSSWPGRTATLATARNHHAGLT